MTHVISVCATCLKEGETAPKGPALAARLAAAVNADADSLADTVEVRLFECLSSCANAQALAFRAPGKAAYLFAGLDAESDCADILAFTRMFVESSDGWIEDARPAGRLRFCLTGRIPALDAGQKVMEPAP